MILGHIGVRAGSKGVPGKNMKLLQGKPLLQWSLDHLLDHPMIDHVVISTDGPEMYAFGQDRGALDIELRPAELATDTASKWDVWRHALTASEALIDEPIEVFIDLDVTSPLRDADDITNVITLFREERPDMVMTCTPAHRNPYFNLVEPDETGALHVSKKLPGNIVSRQQAPVVYEHTGVCYAIRPDYIKEVDWIYEGRVIPYVAPQERCFDIDNPLDFEIADWLMGRKLAAME
ncbi:MAG: acylneuraminate cytidylyltransferase family protein [Pseudomonadota bacterium]